jgi:hypothetical protein
VIRTQRHREQISREVSVHIDVNGVHPEIALN